MTYLTFSPAKINLFLNVINKRDDGFHNIESLVQKISLFDIIRIKYSLNHDIVRFSNKNINPEDNTVSNILKFFKRYANIKNNYEIFIQKNIPTGAGLGGGSSNGGAVLKFLNFIEGNPLNFKEMLKVASMVGSDIPLFISDKNQLLIKGKGEILAESEINMKNILILLVKPNFSISTKTVYKKLNFELTNKNKSINRAHSQISDFVNDLEKVVIREFPIIEEIKNVLVENGSSLALMSGSGSTVFGIFDNRNYLNKAYSLLFNKYKNFNYYICRNLY